MLSYAFGSYEELSILYPRPRVFVEAGATTGSADVVFLLLRGRDARPDMEGLGDDLDRWVEKVGDYTRLFRLKITFVKKDDDWLVQRAHLEHFDPVSSNHFQTGRMSILIPSTRRCCS